MALGASPATFAHQLGSLLRLSGVAAVYGEPVDGLTVVPVPDAARARLLARAHERVLGERALVSSDRTLERSGSAPRTIRLEGEGDLDLVAGAVRDPAGHGWILYLALDLAAPARSETPPPASIESAHADEASLDPVLEALAQDEHMIVLAGPGVVRAGAVAGLHALASAGALGVLNTWGAKGVFDWRSRHHVATIGLQELDFELGGLGEADLILAVGLDGDEAAPSRWQLAPFAELDPSALSALAERAPVSRSWGALPPLRPLLAGVTQRGWDGRPGPIAPSQVTRDYASVLGPAGLVAADAGVAGFWVARTYSTTVLGSVQVPAAPEPGFAAAAALVSRLHRPSRPVLAVTDGPLTDETEQILDLARTLGAGFGLEVWVDGGEALDAVAHQQRTSALSTFFRVEVATLEVARWQLSEIVDVAGPVVAWTQDR